MRAMRASARWALSLDAALLMALLLVNRSGVRVIAVDDGGVVAVEPAKSFDRSVAPRGELRVALPLRGAVGQVEARLVRARHLLQACRRGPPERLVAPQGRGDVGPAALDEAGRQGRAVCDGLRGALRHEGQHGVAGVAKEGDAADGPAVERGAVEERPDEGLVHRPDDRAHLRMPPLEGGQRVGDLATVGPGFPGPGLALADRDEVDEPAARDEVVHEVPTWAHPVVGQHFELEMAEPIRGDEPAIGDAAGEARLLRPEELAAHRGMDAVGADEDAGRDRRAAGEPQLHAIAVVREAGEAMAEAQTLGGQ